MATPNPLAFAPGPRRVGGRPGQGPDAAVSAPSGRPPQPPRIKTPIDHRFRQQPRPLPAIVTSAMPAFALRYGLLSVVTCFPLRGMLALMLHAARAKVQSRAA